MPSLVIAPVGIIDAKTTTTIAQLRDQRVKIHVESSHNAQQRPTVVEFQCVKHAFELATTAFPTVNQLHRRDLRRSMP